jgi:hypothetical protein
MRKLTTGADGWWIDDIRVPVWRTGNTAIDTASDTDGDEDRA